MWLARAVGDVEFVDKCISDEMIYLNLDEIKLEGKTVKKQEDLYNVLTNIFNKDNNNKVKVLNSDAKRIYRDIKMNINDWIVLINEVERNIHIGKIISYIGYYAIVDKPYDKYMCVDWVAQDISIDEIDQELISSIGEIMGISGI